MPAHCVVKACKSRASVHLKNEGLTFHRFPQNPLMREKWQKIIGKNRGDESYNPNDTSVICSRHFLESEMYMTEKGFRRLKKSAIPHIEDNENLNSIMKCKKLLSSSQEELSASTSNIKASHVEVCRVCLATDVKMFNLQYGMLKYCMEAIAELHTHFRKEGFPQYVCYECGAHILKYSRFIEKSKIAHATLIDILAENGEITKDLVREKDRQQLKLQSALMCKTTAVLASINDKERPLGLRCDSNEIVIKIEPPSIIKPDNDHEDNLLYHDNCNIKTEETNESLVDLSTNDEHIAHTFKSEDTKMFNAKEFTSDENCGIDKQFYITLELGTAKDAVKCKESDLNTQYLTQDLDTSSSNSGNKGDENTTKRHIYDENENGDTQHPNVNKKKTVRRRSVSNQPGKAKVMRKISPAKNIEKLTPDEAAIEKLTCFNIVDLSLQEQIEEWKNEVEQPHWWAHDEVYKCEICLKKFPKKNACEKHSAQHKPIRGNSECQVCKERYQNEKRLYAHTIRTHSKRYICKICPKVFNNFCAARRHAGVHSGREYACARCAYRTTRRSAWWVHVRTQHAQAHHCARCGRAFVSAKGLVTHIAKQHPDEENKTSETFRCEDCDIDFNSEGARGVHLLTSKQHKHDKKSNLALMTTCRRCAATFASKRELRDHVQTVHWHGKTPQRPQKEDVGYPRPCEHCGVEMESRQKHWYHVMRAHRALRHTYRPVVTAVCDKCGKGFQTVKQLQLHELRHGSPLYSCAQCPRRFYDHYALRRHAATHSTHKPYRCAVCASAFKIKTNLNRHMRMHTGATPYECNLCNKKFKYWDSLSQHMKHLHQKMPWPHRARRPARSKKADDEIGA